jgi:hypothetical protein
MSKVDKVDEPKLSEKINEYTARDYFVTAARWKSTYEIGIRSKGMSGDFTLLQSNEYNHQSVQEMAEIVCCALDHGYDPKWCQEYLT